MVRVWFCEFVTALRTGTTLTAIIALGTRTTLTTVWALTALTTCRTLLITLGLLNQHTVAELELTGLRVNLKQLHLNLVAFFQSISEMWSRPSLPGMNSTKQP